MTAIIKATRRVRHMKAFLRMIILGKEIWRLHERRDESNDVQKLIAFDKQARRNVPDETVAALRYRRGFIE